MKKVKFCTLAASNGYRVTLSHFVSFFFYSELAIMAPYRTNIHRVKLRDMVSVISSQDACSAGTTWRTHIVIA